LLRATARASGVDRALSTALAPWRADRATHDPGKVIMDLASAVALGGDCLADLGVVRSQPALFGLVASDPTVSRLITRLAADMEVSLPAIRQARARALSGWPTAA
jgi:Transposase DDE domain group 1